MTTNMHTLASDRIPLLIPILHSGTTNYTETQQINRDHVAEDERINELTTTTAKKKNDETLKTTQPKVAVQKNV